MERAMRAQDLGQAEKHIEMDRRNVAVVDEGGDSANGATIRCASYQRRPLK